MLAAGMVALTPVGALAGPVSLSGGWVADFSPGVTDTTNRSTVVFTIDGSYKLVGFGNKPEYFGVACVGMESTLKQAGGANPVTKGAGRCEFKDRGGDRLFAAIDTAFDGITFRCLLYTSPSPRD